MGNASSGLLRIGLTGGIASGKTVVADMFAELGIPVIDTDEIARQIVAPGEPALAEIVAVFGVEILMPDGSLDRAKLRRLIFADDARRSDLEAILHPRIRGRTLEIASSAGGPYQLLVVPLLLETGFRQLVDRILVVDCPESIQRDRLVARDQASTDLVEQIMSAQMARSDRLSAADDVIDNAGSLAETRKQVAEVHARYLERAGTA